MNKNIGFAKFINDGDGWKEVPNARFMMKDEDGTEIEMTPMAVIEQLMMDNKSLEKEILRLTNTIDLIRNNIDITIQIIKEQPTGNDEWILERLDGIRNICKELKEGKE